MSDIKKILQKLAGLKRDGYAQVSLTELSWHTGLENDALLPSLAKAGVKTIFRNGEIFVSLESHAQYSNLPKPKSLILREIE